jgi:hypothetical protein
MKSNKFFQETLSTIGAHLADLRIKKGYPTVRAFTEKYNLPEIQYWRMEKGKTNVTLKSLMRILAIHKLSLEDFFCLLNDEKLAA